MPVVQSVLEWPKVPRCQGLKVLVFKGAKGNKGAEVKRSTQGQGVLNS